MTALSSFFFFNDTATTEIYTLSLHDALPICTPPLMHWISGIIVAGSGMLSGVFVVTVNAWMNAPTGFEVTDGRVTRSEEHTPELQSRPHLVCRLLLSTTKCLHD